jgi:hypothetical protein
MQGNSTIILKCREIKQEFKNAAKFNKNFKMHGNSIGILKRREIKQEF